MHRYKRQPFAAMALLVVLLGVMMVLGAGGFSHKAIATFFTSWASFAVMALCIALFVFLMLNGRLVLEIDQGGILCPDYSPDRIPFSRIQSARLRKIGGCHFVQLELINPTARLALAETPFRRRRHVVALRGTGSKCSNLLTVMRDYAQENKL